jgi:hypothetical protein
MARKGLSAVAAYRSLSATGFPCASADVAIVRTRSMGVFEPESAATRTDLVVVERAGWLSINSIYEPSRKVGVSF